MRSSVAVSIAVIAAVALPLPGTAIVGTRTHPYDDLQHLQQVGTHYPGYVYGSTAVVLCVPNYNAFGYPPSPRSPRCVAAETQFDNPMRIAAADPLHWFTSLEGWCVAGRPFSSPYPVVVELLDVAGAVAATTTCMSNYGAGSTFHVASALPSAQVRIRGPAHLWVVDHLVFGSLA